MSNWSKTLSPANCRVIGEELLLIRRWMTRIWLIADKGGTRWSCFESSKGPQCFKVLFFFSSEYFFLLVEGKNKQINKQINASKKKILSFWILSFPWSCFLIRKCKCASTYLEELSIQFFCHKNTWKREELHLEELFSRYPPVLRIQFFFCYLRQQRPTTGSVKCIVNEEIMQLTCNSDRVCFNFIVLNVLLQMQRCLFCIPCFLRESSLLYILAE